MWSWIRGRCFTISVPVLGLLLLTSCNCFEEKCQCDKDLKDCRDKVQDRDEEIIDLQDEVKQLQIKLRNCPNCIEACVHLNSPPSQTGPQGKRNGQDICEWSDYLLAQGLHARGQSPLALKFARAVHASLSARPPGGGPNITNVVAFINWVDLREPYYGNWRHTFVPPSARAPNVYWPSYNSVMSIEIIHRQHALAAMGFYGPQAPDNQAGPKTRDAIRRFQTAVGLMPTGQLLEEQLVRLIAIAAGPYNDAHSQVVLGTMYLTGLGIQKDGDRAKDWYLKAHNRNPPNKHAAFNLGMYHEERAKNANRSIANIISDLNDSIAFYRSAQRAGHPHGAQAAARAQLRLDKAKKL